MEPPARPKPVRACLAGLPIHRSRRRPACARTEFASALPNLSYHGSKLDSTNSTTCFRRRLPHWRQEGSTYFLTWRVRPDQPRLSDEERTVVSQAIRHFDGQRYNIAAFVVMDDHVHVLLSLDGTHQLSAIVHSWKTFTAHSIQRSRGKRGSTWQDEYFDRIIRSEREFIDKANYIFSNPFVRWPGIEEYPWTGGQGSES